jgi:hypothetical protein
MTWESGKGKEEIMSHDEAQLIQCGDHNLAPWAITCVVRVHCGHDRLGRDGVMPCSARWVDGVGRGPE